MKSTSAYVLAALMLVSVYAQDEESTFSGFTPKISFENMSPDNNPWSGTTQAGAGIGFTLLGLSYLYTVAMIFWDITKSK